MGLADNTLDPESLPLNIVEGVASTMRGTPSRGVDEPFLEQLLSSFLREIERTEVERRGFFVRKARWPEGAPYAVCLTHDVDNISRPFRHTWKTRSRFSTSDLAMHFLRLSSIYNNTEEIAREEGMRGFHSSFYFLTSNYPLVDVKKTARILDGKGWDVGLHGDFGTHDSLERMLESVGRLSAELGLRPRGVREHYLKFEFGKTWEIMDAAGFDYDSTVGLNDRLGFKLGLATPFHPPDSKWNPLRLLELPLTLMDTTLWGYLKKDEQSGASSIQTMIDKVKSVGGLFTLLWHQEAVKMRGGRLYWRLLDQFKGDGCFVGSGAEIADWWARRSVPLVIEGSRFRFKGDAPVGARLILKTNKPAVVVAAGTLRQEDGVSIISVDGADMSAQVG